MMAIDDDSFYNVHGEEISRNGLVEQIIAFYNLKFDVGETRVTDFNEGSEIRNLIEAICVDNYILMEEKNELTKTGFIDTAEGEYLDRHGANPHIRIERDLGQEATGFVTFNIAEAVDTELIIPEGTLLVNENTGLEYATDNECIFAVGDTEVTASITCLTSGEDGNCIAGEINTISDAYLDIPSLTVVNNNDITGGTDYEDDDDYRERLLNYVRKDDFGSLGYYSDVGNNVDGVHDVLLVDSDNPIYIKEVIVNGFEKPVPNTILLDVLKAYSLNENIVIGHTFNIKRPNYVVKNLTINLDVAVEIETENIQNMIQLYVNGGSDTNNFIDFNGLNIGQGTSKTELTDILYIIEDIKNATIIDTDTGTEIETITVNNDEVLQIGNIQINQNIIGA